MSEHDGKIHEDIGYIRGIVEGIDKKVTAQNGAIAELKQTVSRHEVIFGKIGLGLSAATFVMVAFFNITIEWVKKTFLT